MASGRLGNAAIAATAVTTVYTVPTNTYSVATLSITNRNSTPATIRVALSTSDTPALEEYIEFDTPVIANGVFERTGLVLDAGLKIVVYSDVSNVGCTVYGIETTTA